MTCDSNLALQLIQAIAQFNTDTVFVLCILTCLTLKLQTCTALQHQVLFKLHQMEQRHYQTCRQHQVKRRRNKQKKKDHRLPRGCHWGPFSYVWVLISPLQRSTNQRELQQHQEYIIYAAQSLLHSLRGLVQNWLKIELKNTK